jgi:hypothetical protein
MSCQPKLWKADNAYLIYFMLQRQLSRLNGRKLDHLFIFPVSGFALFYAEKEA